MAMLAEEATSSSFSPPSKYALETPGIYLHYRPRGFHIYPDTYSQFLFTVLALSSVLCKDMPL